VLDCLITGGTVVDGTGGPARQESLGVRDGRIVDVDGESARRTIDATGLVVAPGFVDLHTHYDAQLSWDPAATPSPLHGVTTVIGGNCGFTLAPAGPDNADYLARMMARVEGMPLDALRAGLDWSWTSYADWLGQFPGRLAVNAGFLVGHSTLRRAVLGAAAPEATAEGEQLEAMARLLHEALAAGGLGFSTSQAPTHHDGDGAPVPSRAAGRDELLALSGAVAGHAGTTLELILPGCLAGFSDDEVDLMTAMSLAAGRPANWNVLPVTAAGRAAYEHQLEASTTAAERGTTVVALTLPHPMQIRLSFLSGFVLDGFPGWADVMHLPVAERLAALTDPGVRARLNESARSREAGILRALSRWERLTFAETFASENAGLDGRNVGEVAAERGADPFDALLDVVVADGLRTGITPPAQAETDEDWAERAQVWRDPRAVIGGSDAGAHLDMMCGAVYTTHLLGESVRERSLLSIEEAVRQLTDVPARLYGLRERGRIAPGWHADLVLFDPERIEPGPVRTRTDLPSGAPRLYAEADGVEHVLVGGTEVVTAGSVTGALPGTLLRSGADTETVPVPAATV
jgi:N-acyl-D-aspartate/D-glutamate deacylase